MQTNARCGNSLISSCLVSEFRKDCVGKIGLRDCCSTTFRSSTALRATLRPDPFTPMCCQPVSGSKGARHNGPPCTSSNCFGTYIIYIVIVTVTSSHEHIHIYVIQHESQHLCAENNVLESAKLVAWQHTDHGSTGQCHTRAQVLSSFGVLQAICSSGSGSLGQPIVVLAIVTQLSHQFRDHLNLDLTM